MSFLKNITRAIVAPESRHHPTSLLRQLLLKQRLFDLGSVLLQSRDLRRRKCVRNEYALADDHHRKVQDYNGGVTQEKDYTRTRRAEVLYKILALPPRRLRDEKLLIVGPRDVHELYIAWLHGFAWSNIRAIDLYSTNSKIEVMNMEAMTFDANSFDAVAMAQTLAYAEDTKQCLTEVARVLKPGGRFVFGATYCPASREWKGNHVSGNEIHSMLKQLEMDVYFYVPQDKINGLGQPQTSHLIGARKRIPEETPFDRIDL